MTAPVRFPPRSAMPMHRHALAYCAVVLEGSYEERSADGRWIAEAGDLVIHPRFHAHANAFSTRGAWVVDLDPRALDAEVYGVWRIRDPEALLRGEYALPEAVSSGCRRPGESPGGWLAEFAEALRGDAPPPVAVLSRRFEITREHAARAFTRWFGLSPQAYAGEHRLRRALESLENGQAPADAAHECGFYDQPHLTRSLRRHLGVTPGMVRKRPSTSANRAP